MHALARSQSSWQRATVRPFLALEPLGRPSQTDVFFSLAASQRETVRRIISDDVADRLGSVWGADAQGEIPGVWVRPARLPSSRARTHLSLLRAEVLGRPSLLAPVGQPVPGALLQVRVA